MANEDKIKFVLETLESASNKYLLYPNLYNRIEEIWIDLYLTKSNFNTFIQSDNNVNLVYPIILEMSKK